MTDIIDEAWHVVAEFALLAEEAGDEQARKFFENLAESWRRIARNYETIAANDGYLARLSEREVRS